MENYILFFSTVLFLAFTPGPNIILMINNGLKYTLKQNINSICGFISGFLLLAALSIFIVQGVLSINQNVFKVLKVIGSLYLLYLAIKIIFSKKSKLNFSNQKLMQEINKFSLFKESFFCCITNPKALFIYIILIPNFINNNSNMLIQNIILIIIQIFCITLSLFFYAIVANKSANLFAKHIKIVSYISGSVLIFFALSLFFSK